MVFMGVPVVPKILKEINDISYKGLYENFLIKGNKSKSLLYWAPQKCPESGWNYLFFLVRDRKQQGGY